MNQDQFTPIDQSITPKLSKYYTSLEMPLADLNAAMMVSWQEVLDLHYFISEEEILYVYGFFEGEYYGWGPPLGRNLSLLHIRHFTQFLETLNNGPASILYLWQQYSLYPLLASSKEYALSTQASEYIYEAETLAHLPTAPLKAFRKQRDYFYRKFKPVTKEYSMTSNEDCLTILDRWISQKRDRVPSEFLEKFELEADVCRTAFTSKLPLEGVIIYVDDTPVAFSLGTQHSKDCFNCMFEKTDLSLNGLSIVVFSELGRSSLKKYRWINAGEDWGIPYLQKTKLKWQPHLIQDSFQLSRRS